MVAITLIREVFFNLLNDKIVQRNKNKKFQLVKTANYSHLIDFMLSSFYFLLQRCISMHFVVNKIVSN